MKHERFRQWLSLSIYGELSEDEQSRLGEHLEKCQTCRQELTELRRLQSLLDSNLAEPPPGLLAEARAQLRGSLRAQRPPSRVLSLLPPLGRLQTPIALAASLLVGLLLGRWMLPSAAPEAPDDWLARGLGLANIQFLDADPSDGELEVRFDAVRTIQLRAAFSDPRIQAVLLGALRAEGNPGTRIQAVAAVQEEAAPSRSESLRGALIEAVKFDENAGVRKRALSVLAEMPRRADVQRALIHVLVHDPNPGLRVAAITALESDAVGEVSLDQETLRQLEQSVSSEKNDFIRLRSKALLEEVRFQ